MTARVDGAVPWIVTPAQAGVQFVVAGADLVCKSAAFPARVRAAELKTNSALPCSSPPESAVGPRGEDAQHQEEDGAQDQEETAHPHKSPVLLVPSLVPYTQNSVPDKEVKSPDCQGNEPVPIIEELKHPTLLSVVYSLVRRQESQPIKFNKGKPTKPPTTVLPKGWPSHQRSKRKNKSAAFITEKVKTTIFRRI